MPDCRCFYVAQGQLQALAAGLVAQIAPDSQLGALKVSQMAEEDAKKIVEQ